LVGEGYSSLKSIEKDPLYLAVPYNLKHHVIFATFIPLGVKAIIIIDSYFHHHIFECYGWAKW